MGGDSVRPRTAQAHSPFTRATQVWLPCPALMPRHPGRAGLAPLPHPAIVSITPAVPILGYAGCPIIGRHPLLSTCTCQRPGAPLTAHEVSRQRQFCTQLMIDHHGCAPIIECTSGGSSSANRPTASLHSLGSSPANGTLAHRLSCKESGTWGGTANPFANPWSPQLHKATFAASCHESIISPQAKCRCTLACWRCVHSDAKTNLVVSQLPALPERKCDIAPSHWLLVLSKQTLTVPLSRLHQSTG